MRKIGKSKGRGRGKKGGGSAQVHKALKRSGMQNTKIISSMRGK